MVENSTVVLLTPIILFIILMILLYVPPVQNLIRKQATAIASDATGMDISVERIDLRFPLICWFAVYWWYSLPTVLLRCSIPILC